jgi:class 3 adenylate cyclase/YHS domain-containing protein
MGDVAAAQVVRRFSELVHEATKRWEGRVVERIGDAFLLVFPKAAWAVTCALEIERLAAAEPQFLPVRCGAHWGQILYREGGYVGTNVNIASRVAAEARRHQILVTDAIRAEAGVLPGAHFTPRGKRRLKGVTDELEIFEVRSRDIEQTDKVLDVVCGMELSAAEVAARISLGDEERAFCSEKCLRMFIAAPEKYRI